FNVGKDRQAAAVIGFPIKSRRDRACGSLQEARVQPVFETLEYLGGGGARDSDVLCRQCEAAPLNDPREQAHGRQLVHRRSYCSCIWNYQGKFRAIIFALSTKTMPITPAQGRSTEGLEMNTSKTSNAKVALVTGASRGIGAAIAERLGRE